MKVLDEEKIELYVNRKITGMHMAFNMFWVIALASLLWSLFGFGYNAQYADNRLFLFIGKIARIVLPLAILFFLYRITRLLQAFVSAPLKFSIDSTGITEASGQHTIWADMKSIIVYAGTINIERKSGGRFEILPRLIKSSDVQNTIAFLREHAPDELFEKERLARG